MSRTESGRFERAGKRYEQQVPVTIVFVGSPGELMYWTETVQSLRDFYREKKDIEVLIDGYWCQNPVQAASYLEAGRIDIIVSRIYFADTCNRKRPSGILTMITQALTSGHQKRPPRILLYDRLFDSIKVALEDHFAPLQQDGVFISFFDSNEADEKRNLVRDLAGAVAESLDPLFHYAGEVRA